MQDSPISHVYLHRLVELKTGYVTGSRPKTLPPKPLKGTSRLESHYVGEVSLGRWEVTPIRHDILLRSAAYRLAPQFLKKPERREATNHAFSQQCVDALRRQNTV